MEQKRKSVTFTAIIWAGIVIALAGAVATVAGWAGSSVLKITASDNFTVETTSSGIALVVIGAGLVAITIRNLPEDVSVFSEDAPAAPYDWTRKLQLPAVVITGVAVVALVVSLILGGSF